MKKKDKPFDLTGTSKDYFLSMIGDPCICVTRPETATELVVSICPVCGRIFG